MKNNGYVLTCPKGKKYTTTNLSKFCRDNEVSLSGASKCARGLCKSFQKGWICRYADSVESKKEGTSELNIRTYKHKGALWYHAGDILTCLGYSKTSTADIRYKRGDITPFIENLRERYWNATSLVRLKNTLMKCDETKWQNMLKVLEEAKSASVFNLSDDKVLENPAIVKLKQQVFDLQQEKLELTVEVKSNQAMNNSLQSKLSGMLEITYVTKSGLLSKEVVVKKFTTSLAADICSITNSADFVRVNNIKNV